jgi:hypothetical protein
VPSRLHPVTGDEQIAPWADLSDVVKEENRALVRTVYAALDTVAADVSAPVAERFPEPPDVAERFPEPPEMKRSYPPRPRRA